VVFRILVETVERLGQDIRCLDSGLQQASILLLYFIILQVLFHPWEFYSDDELIFCMWAGGQQTGRPGHRHAGLEFLVTVSITTVCIHPLLL
jgi:hypothetical protein